MAVYELSPKLKAFQDSVSNIDAVKSKESEVCLELGNIATKLDNVISEFSQAANDSQCSELKSCIGLAKDGINQTKDCVTQVLESLFADCDLVINLIKTILTLCEKVSGLEAKLGSLTVGENATPEEKSRVESEKASIRAEIEKIGQEIEFDNREGESMLEAMQEAMSSVSFGVVGNMKNGGSLGPKSLYECSYTISEFVEKTAPDESDSDADGDPNGNDGQNGDKLVVRDSFLNANEFDELNLPAHRGQSDVICIPRNMREMKDAMKNGQPIILENCKFQYDFGGFLGTGVDYYDALGGTRLYFVKCDDGCYRQVDENGKLVNGEERRIDPERIYQAGDYNQKTGLGFTWSNDTALKYNGQQRESTKPVQTGVEQIDFAKANAGDAYVGKFPNGQEIHRGSCNVVATPKSMVELKKAMKNGQPIRLDGVKLIYDHGRAYGRNLYDATKEPIYLVQDSVDGNYRQVDVNGNNLRGDWIIDPDKIFEAADNGKFEWDNGWANPFSWHLNDTVFENWQ